MHLDIRKERGLIDENHLKRRLRNGNESPSEGGKVFKSETIHAYGKSDFINGPFFPMIIGVNREVIIGKAMITPTGVINCHMHFRCARACGSTCVSAIIKENGLFYSSMEDSKGYITMHTLITKRCFKSSSHIKEGLHSLIMYSKCTSISLTSKEPTNDDRVNKYVMTKDVGDNCDNIATYFNNGYMLSTRAATYFSFHVSAEIKIFVPEMNYNQANGGKIKASKSLGFYFDPGGTNVLKEARECKATVKFHLEDKVVLDGLGNTYHALAKREIGVGAVNQVSSWENVRFLYKLAWFNHTGEVATSFFVQLLAKTQIVAVENNMDVDLSCYVVMLGISDFSIKRICTLNVPICWFNRNCKFLNVAQEFLHGCRDKTKEFDGVIKQLIGLALLELINKFQACLFTTEKQEFNDMLLVKLFEKAVNFQLQEYGQNMLIMRRCVDETFSFHELLLLRHFY